jgi:uncharacterized protein
MTKQTAGGGRLPEAGVRLPAAALRSDAAGIVFAVKVVPRAPHSAIDGWHEHMLKVRLQAPPVEGKANAALIALLAEVLDVGKRQIEIIGGLTARTKRVRVHGLTADQLAMRLKLSA